MDLACRVKTNHIGWIKRILRNPICSSAEVLRNILGEENINLALSFKQPPSNPNKTLAPFYGTILATWLETRDFEPSSELDIRGEVLWQNHHISSPRHMLRQDQWGSWSEAGMTMVHHLCHETNNRILGHEEIQEKYQIKCNFLQALTIRNSIPFSWRRQISPDFQEEISLKHIFYINHKRFDIQSSNP